MLLCCRYLLVVYNYFVVDMIAKLVFTLPYPFTPPMIATKKTEELGSMANQAKFYRMFFCLFRCYRLL